MIKRAVLAFSLLSSSAAYAWDTPPPAAATATARQHQTQNQNQHQSQRQSQHQTANGGAGGGGGAGGSGYASTGSVSVSGSGNTRGGLGITVPDLGIGSSCGGGISIGGIGASGGGSGGGALWEFGECKIIREADALNKLGYPDAAVAELCQIDRVKEAFGGKCPSPEGIQIGYGRDYCFTRDAGDTNQHKECDSPPSIRRVR